MDKLALYWCFTSQQGEEGEEDRAAVVRPRPRRLVSNYSTAKSNRIA